MRPIDRWCTKRTSSFTFLCLAAGYTIIIWHRWLCLRTAEGLIGLLLALACLQMLSLPPASPSMLLLLCCCHNECVMCVLAQVHRHAVCVRRCRRQQQHIVHYMPSSRRLIQSGNSVGGDKCGAVSVILADHFAFVYDTFDSCKFEFAKHQAYAHFWRLPSYPSTKINNNDYIIVSIASVTTCRFPFIAHPRATQLNKLLELMKPLATVAKQKTDPLDS